MSKPPDTIAIDHDDYHANHVGRTGDGRQFFLTSPFVPAIDGHPGREFIALYLFDSAGRFQDAHIEDLGTRAGLDEQQARGLVEALLADLGKREHCRIEVAPFQIERLGTTFGLVPRPPEDDEDGWFGGLRGMEMERAIRPA